MYKGSVKFVFSLVLFFLVVHVGFAHAESHTNYYVSTSGDNSNNGITPDTAWRTIQYAVTQKSKVNPGDSILIMPGTYNGVVVMNGSTSDFEWPSTANTSVEGSNTARVTIKGSDPNDPPVITNGQDKKYQWLVIDVSNVTFENITFRDYYYSGFKVFAEKQPVSNITIKGLKLINQQVPDGVDVGWQGKFGILVSSTKNDFPMENIRVENNYLERIVAKAPDGTGHECMRINGDVNHIIVQDNTIDTCSGLGIDLLGLDRPPNFVRAQPNYVVVRRNTIKGMYKMPTATATATSIYFDRAGYKILIDGNRLIANNQAANGIKTNVESNTTDGLEGFGDIIIRNNLKVGKGPGLFLGIGTNNTPSSGQIRNNQYMDRIATVHNVSMITDTATPINYTGSRFTSTKNNIFVASGSRMQFFPDWLNDYPDLRNAERESNGNVWYSNASSQEWYWGPGNSYPSFTSYRSQSGQDNNSYYANPQFTNTGNLNYKLVSGSPGVDLGIALTNTTASGTNTKVIPVVDPKYFYDGWDIPGEVGDKIVVGANNVTITDVNYSTKTLTVDRNVSFANNSDVHYYFEGVGPDMGILPAGFYQYDAVTPPPISTPTITPTPSPLSLLTYKSPVDGDRVDSRIGDGGVGNDGNGDVYTSYVVRIFNPNTTSTGNNGGNGDNGVYTFTDTPNLTQIIGSNNGGGTSNGDVYDYEIVGVNTTDGITSLVGRDGNNNIVTDGISYGSNIKSITGTVSPLNPLTASGMVVTVRVWRR
jgi:hypothetical protein